MLRGGKTCFLCKPMSGGGDVLYLTTQELDSLQVVQPRQPGSCADRLLSNLLIKLSRLLTLFCGHLAQPGIVTKRRCGRVLDVLWNLQSA